MIQLSPYISGRTAVIAVLLATLAACDPACSPPSDDAPNDSDTGAGSDDGGTCEGAQLLFPDGYDLADAVVTVRVFEGDPDNPDAKELLVLEVEEAPLHGKTSFCYDYSSIDFVEGLDYGVLAGAQIDPNDEILCSEFSGVSARAFGPPLPDVEMTRQATCP